jgi:sulfide:quinone oxidoreductase
MQINRLTPDLAVGPQITETDLATIAALGFRSIIGNRPEGEAPDQPPFASLAAAAERQGLRNRHIPVVASQINSQDIERFREALRDLPKPIFAFCRTGTRSTILWALANSETLTADERIRMAAAHGYDIGGLRSSLEAADQGAAGHA